MTTFQTCVSKFVFIAAIATLAFIFSGCHEEDITVYIVDDVLINTPPGGENFGDLDYFGVASAQKAVSDVDDADGFPFFLWNDSVVVISLESLDSLNPFVELYDENGILVAADDDSGVGSDSLIVADLEIGDYTVVVWSSEDGPYTGDYELNVIVGSLGADLEIMEIGVSTTLSDIEMAAGDDTQTFVFTLEDPASVDFTAMQTSGAADLAFQLIDQRGAEVFFFDTAGLDDPEVLAEPLDRGTYLLVVSNDQAADDGVYDLTVSVNP